MTVDAWLLVSAASASLWAVVFFMGPLIANARFVAELSRLRDEVDDAVIDKTLPASEPVERFTAKVDVLMEDPHIVSFSRLLAIHMTYQEQSTRLAPKPITYAGLTPPQRRTMHKFDDELVTAMARKITVGSRFFVPFWCARQVLRGSTLLQQGRKLVSAPRPEQLATEFNRFEDPRHFQGV